MQTPNLVGLISCAYALQKPLTTGPTKGRFLQACYRMNTVRDGCAGLIIVLGWLRDGHIHVHRSVSHPSVYQSILSLCRLCWHNFEHNRSQMDVSIIEYNSSVQEHNDSVWDTDTPIYSDLRQAQLQYMYKGITG